MSYCSLQLVQTTLSERIFDGFKYLKNKIILIFSLNKLVVTKPRGYGISSSRICEGSIYWFWLLAQIEVRNFNNKQRNRC